MRCATTRRAAAASAEVLLDESVAADGGRSAFTWLGCVSAARQPGLLKLRAHLAGSGFLALVIEAAQVHALTFVSHSTCRSGRGPRRRRAAQHRGRARGRRAPGAGRPKGRKPACSSDLKSYLPHATHQPCCPVFPKCPKQTAVFWVRGEGFVQLGGERLPPNFSPRLVVQAFGDRGVWPSPCARWRGRAPGAWLTLARVRPACVGPCGRSHGLRWIHACRGC